MMTMMKQTIFATLVLAVTTNVNAEFNQICINPCNFYCYKGDCEKDAGGCYCRQDDKSFDKEHKCANLCTEDKGLTECVNDGYCYWMSDECERAAPACFYRMLTNDVCDEACNVPECEFDAGKCTAPNDIIPCESHGTKKECKSNKECSWNKKKCYDRTPCDEMRNKKQCKRNKCSWKKNKCVA